MLVGNLTLRSLRILHPTSLKETLLVSKSTDVIFKTSIEGYVISISPIANLKLRLICPSC